MVSTTGEHYAYFELDDDLKPQEKELPANLRESVARIKENCEPACVHGAVHGWRGRIAARGRHRKSGEADAFGARCADARDLRRRARRTCGRAAASRSWSTSPHAANAFGYVPTPALVAPIEFTLRLADYAALGGYMDHVRSLSSVVAEDQQAAVNWPRAQIIRGRWNQEKRANATKTKKR
jgi:6-hydroxynicotinate reductase